MGLVNSILSYPARLRRSKGFGVHSPFAFAFITKVLRDRESAYYAYPEIDSICKSGCRLSAAGAKMFYRVICRFNPSVIVEIGEETDITNVIFSKAVPSADIIKWHRSLNLSGTNEPLLLVHSVDTDDYDSILRFVLQVAEHNGVIYIYDLCNPVSLKLWGELKDKLSAGMAFYSSKTGIFVARKELPRQNFDILL